MVYSEKVIDHYENPRNVGRLTTNDDNVGSGMVSAGLRRQSAMKRRLKVNDEGIVIEDRRFKTYGCVPRIASSSATEWVKVKILDEAQAIKTPTLQTNWCRR